MKTTHFLITIALVFAALAMNGCGGSGGKNTSANPDAPAPTPGNSGTITVKNVQDHSSWIEWTQATDEETPFAALEYKIVRSKSNNIGTVSDAEANGTVAKDWTNDLCWSGSTDKTTSWELVGLANNTTYYYTVLVKNEAGKKAAYTVISQATLSTTHNRLPFANGRVNAMVSDGTNLYIGGSFTSIGGTLNGAAIDATGSGSLAASVVQPVIDGEIKAVASDGIGGWYIGGNFTNINGVTRNRLARINADGSLHAWNPDANNTVNALAGSGNTVYIGGSFTTIGGTPRNRLAAIGADGTLSSWNPSANTIVCALAISGSTVYIGGYFTTIGGTTRNALAAIDTDGTLLSWDPNAGAGNVVYALAISGNIVYIGGSFVRIGGTDKLNCAAVNRDGTVLSWPQYGPGSAVKALAISGNTVYMGGDFTSIAFVGTARNHLAAMDITDGTLLSWNPNASGSVFAPSSSVNSLAISGSTVYIGGDFTIIGGTTRNGLAAVGTDGTLLSWDPNAIRAPSANSDVNAIAIHGSTIYAGGNFSIGGTARNCLAAIGADGTVLSWDPNAYGPVYALAIDGSRVYVGGEFTQIGGTTRNRLAAIHTNGSLQSWDPNANGAVHALAIRGSIVYAGGNFTSIGGTTRNYLAAINGAGGMDEGTLSEGWKTSADGIVNAIAISGVTVYVGGEFTQIDEGSGSGYQTRNHLAAIDNDGVLDSLNLDPDDAVTALAIMEDGSLLYTGGYFSNIDGTSRNGLGAIDIDVNSLSSWNPNPNNGVNALALSSDGNTVYIGGYFSSIGGTTTRNLLAAIGSDGTLSSWNPDVSGNGVNALAIIGSTVYAGGDFNAIGGLPRKNLSAIDISSGLPW